MDKLSESAVYNADQVEDLRLLVATGEGARLEFKRKATHPEKIVREMIAFANTHGGVVLVGVGDDKTIPGLKFPEDESYVIQEALKKCKPTLQFTETFIPIGHNRMVIEYHVPESQKKPHGLQIDKVLTECYVRVVDKSIKASREMKEILRRSRSLKGVRFHYGPHETLLMKYLDEHAFITLPQFMALTQLNRFRSSRKLVLLVLANVLRIQPDERGDHYLLANPSA